jgi:hypothetical protein
VTEIKNFMRQMRPNRYKILLQNNPEYYEKMALEVAANIDKGRNSFFNNMLIGNGAGLAGIAALLAKWPDTAPLLHSLVPSAISFAIGVGASAVCALIMSADDMRHYARHLRRAQTIRMAQDARIDWSDTKLKISNLERRSRKLSSRAEIMGFAAFTLGYIGIIFGISYAIFVISTSSPTKQTPPSRPAPLATIQQI